MNVPLTLSVFGVGDKRQQKVVKISYRTRTKSNVKQDNKN